MRYATIGALCWGFFEGVISYADLLNMISLSDYGLGWTILVVILGVIGFYLYDEKEEEIYQEKDKH